MQVPWGERGGCETCDHGYFFFIQKAAEDINAPYIIISTIPVGLESRSNDKKKSCREREYTIDTLNINTSYPGAVIVASG